MTVAASGLFLGKDLLPWLLLALGGAMVVGNGLALLRPPPQPREDELARAPTRRSLVMMLVGLVAALAAAGTLASR